MKNPTWRLAEVALATMTLVPLWSSYAEDSFPPCWRGNPGTTYENWAFNNASNPATAEVFTNPNGTPQATITVGAFGSGWVPAAFGTKTGVWDIGESGQVSLAVPNYPGVWKYVQVQVTYFDGPLAFPPTISIAGATLVSTAVTNNEVVTNGATYFGTWKTTNTVWLVQPSPSSDTIVVTGDPNQDGQVDQIIVDTRSSASGDGDVAAFRPCWRGQPGSTYQYWQFGFSNNPAFIPPEAASNAYGSPQASLALGSYSSGWIGQNSFYGCRLGIWNLGGGGSMTLSIPNTLSSSPHAYKYVQVQVTQYRDNLVYTANGTVLIAGATLVSQQEQTIETTSFSGGRWVVAQSIWRLGPPCPASEAVVVSAAPNGSLIDQVVVDTLCEDFACPSDLTVNADPGQCTKSNVTWTLPSVNGCTVTNVSSTPPSGSTLAAGTNVVSVVVKDAQGGSGYCAFNVIVTKTQLPTVVCPGDMTVARDPAQCGAVVTFAATAVDICPGATASCSPPSGSLFPVGVTTVTCTARDAVGNLSAPCTFTVRVVDLTGDYSGYRPCWRGQANTTFQQWLFSSNNPTAIVPAVLSNPYGTPQANVDPGSYSSGWIDQNAFYGCRQGIWNLGTNGTITLNIPNVASSPSTAYKYVRVQVTQYRDSLIYTANASVAIAGGALVSQQEQTIETTGFAGGRWVVAQSIWRLGPPCPASETVVIAAPGDGSLIDQVAVDTLCLDIPCPANVAGSADPGQCSKSNVTWSAPTPNGCTVLSVVTKTTNGVVVTSPASFPVGVTPLVLTVTDAEGGLKTCNFSVTITDNEAPVARCKSVVLPLDATGHATLTAAQVDNGSSDNCGITQWLLSKTNFDCSNLGSNSVTLTVKDAPGLESSCVATVTVVDTMAPVITGCPPARTAAAGTNCQAAVPDFTTNTVATDNCGSLTITQNPAAGTLVGIGGHPVTITVKDAANNPATCNTSFTVNGPTITPPVLTAVSKPSSATLRFAFTNSSGGCVTFTVVATTNVAMRLSNWTVLGQAIETPTGSGRYEFTDLNATNWARFYRVISP